jgi:PAS domain S-box-containing protein
MLGLLGIFLLTSYLLTYRRILKAIVTLRAGAAVIGSGNLDFVIEERKNDEIGELSRAFNRMARDLKAVTASKADLEKEIAERERVEEALRQSERDLNFAQAVAQTGSWRLDLHRTVLLWSDETYRIFGIPKEYPMTYETFLGIVHPDDREYVRRKWIAALGGEPYDIEHRIAVGDRVKWIRERGTLEFDASGELLGGFGTAQDITERKQAEEQIRKLNEDLGKRAGELENANKELDAFASMVAHDLKNQLVIIATLIGRLSKQQQEKLDAKGKQYWEIVNESVGAMAALVDDLLEMSRVSRIQMKPERVDLSKLAWSIVKKYQEKDADRQVELIIMERMEAEGDRRLMEVALDNLLGNAWKFTKQANPARIQLGVSVEAEGPIFFIRDNGCGFNCSENAEKVFLPFQRFHTSDEYPGTGLGLATVKRILDRHGGRIWIESKVGKGTTVYFSFGDGSRS